MGPENELKFSKSPTSSSPNRTLKLTNLTHGNVAFKVKTTAPKSYLVRPSSGVLKAKEVSEVSILVQQHDKLSSHRFLVQAVAVPENAETFSKQQWQEVSNDALQEKKLNVLCEVSDNNIPSNNVVGDRSVGSPDESFQDLRAQYKELVQQALEIENTNKRRERDIAAFNPVPSKTGGAGRKGMIVAIVLALLVARIAHYVLNM